MAALAFALGAYQFVRYRKAEKRNVHLMIPEGVDGNDLSRIVEGVTLCRDLTNTPSNDMGPDRFALDIAEIGDVERPPMITVPATAPTRGSEKGLTMWRSAAGSSRSSGGRGASVRSSFPAA